ncbi:E3 ubiquitin-protein ligase UPL3 [Anopheles sinensis]|uniref:E3 ubiquitin-protein ligase UPL3 n=1 Tax=Anopheles sinensis TaxID=74873 RepID=A0A084VYW2_ANOSI|nr:E3 ubiquitin-protein ligase UPL3 [Anopheles sinensis]
MFYDRHGRQRRRSTNHHAGLPGRHQDSSQGIPASLLLNGDEISRNPGGKPVPGRVMLRSGLHFLRAVPRFALLPRVEIMIKFAMFTMMMMNQTDIVGGMHFDRRAGQLLVHVL